MKVLLAISASIAAHRALDFASLLRKNGHEVAPVLSENAPRILAPAAVEAICNHRAILSLWDPAQVGTMDHLALTKWADALVVLPATADTISKIALGLAEDALTTMALAWPRHRPFLICPAMNPTMWANPILQSHVGLLKDQGFHFVGPIHGNTACGDLGEGRLAPVEDVFETLQDLVDSQRGLPDLRQEHLLITGGPTHEFFDPVRVLSNPSTGKMAVCLAQAAVRSGAQVTLIMGPTPIPLPNHSVEVHSVTNAKSMADAVLYHLPRATIVAFAAAVSDWTPLHPSRTKHHKTTVQADAVLNLELVRTPDIAAMAHANRKEGQLFLGFAADDGDTIGLAMEKARRKGFDLVFANPINEPNAGFRSSTNKGWIVEPKEPPHPARIEEIPLAPKSTIAARLLRELAQLRQRRKSLDLPHSPAPAK
jgi:phosphopantothenoylcysteine decarboxylase/phosphopantothenate--cysteine ligase